MMSVTATISTKGRYETTLPLAIEAIATQMRPPEQFVLFDDNDPPQDLRQRSPYKHLFQLFDARGIKWRVVFGQKKGQVANHQLALDQAETDLVWRCDDDNIPASDCLLVLLAQMDDPNVAAAGGAVPVPGAPRNPSFIETGIEFIYQPWNVQWARWPGGKIEVDHLYSTFLYRVAAGREVGGYCRELSPAGHREETMFTYAMKRAGHKLIATPETTTWHLREGTGGIRSFADQGFWQRDEEVFARKLAEWGIVPVEYAFAVLDCGLGDHFVFRSILPEWRRKNARKKLVVGCCYPEVFEREAGLTLISVADAKAAFGSLDRFNVYKFGEDHAWNRPLVEAFMEMYL